MHTDFPVVAWSVIIIIIITGLESVSAFEDVIGDLKSSGT
jgi:hypothetical protein